MLSLQRAAFRSRRLLLVLLAIVLVPRRCVAGKGDKEVMPDDPKLRHGMYHSWSYPTARANMYRMEAKLAEKMQTPALTVYCGCEYGTSTLAVDLESCGLEPRLNPKRMKKVEGEHVVPASVLCGSQKAWTEPASVCEGRHAENGRHCAESLAPCSYAITDLHNLWPAAGEINVDRGNKVSLAHLHTHFTSAHACTHVLTYKHTHPFLKEFVDDVPGEARKYGKCDFEVNFGDPLNKVVEPPDEVKGIIGRVSVYMFDAYTRRGLDILMDDDALTRFSKWVGGASALVTFCVFSALCARKCHNQYATWLHTTGVRAPAKPVGVRAQHSDVGWQAEELERDHNGHVRAFGRVGERAVVGGVRTRAQQTVKGGEGITEDGQRQP
jgi:deoxyribonuclease-1